MSRKELSRSDFFVHFEPAELIIYPNRTKKLIATPISVPPGGMRKKYKLTDGTKFRRVHEKPQTLKEGFRLQYHSSRVSIHQELEPQNTRLRYTLNLLDRCENYNSEGEEVYEDLHALKKLDVKRGTFYIDAKK